MVENKIIKFNVNDKNAIMEKAYRLFEDCSIVTVYFNDNTKTELVDKHLQEACIEMDQFKDGNCPFCYEKLVDNICDYCEIEFFDGKKVEYTK